MPTAAEVGFVQKSPKAANAEPWLAGVLDDACSVLSTL